jgi:AP-1 complex subunit beta-1
MSCIRVAKVMEHLPGPLEQTLKDKDPYVRKTAALAVAKMYDLAPTFTVEKG